MNELHRHRSFPNSGSHTLYGPMPHIAHRKNAGNIGFEQEGISVKRPPLGMLPVTYEVGPGEQKTAFVTRD